MSATDELRRMLDERGVEWESKDVDGVSDFHDTRWNAYGVRWCYAEFVGNNYTKLIPSREFHCTPEQAIAMTLGTEYHGYEQAAIEAWESIKAWNTRAEMSYEDARILLDELGLSERMCHPVIAITDDGGYEYALCSECDGRIEPEDNYCPNCGARRVGE